MDIEIFSINALINAHKNARGEHEREHVTPYIQSNPKFKQKNCMYDIDLSNEENIKILLKKLKIDEHDFFNLIKNQDTKDKLKQFTQEAFEKEVFGAPTFIVNNKIFWGQDRLEYALDEIKKN